MFVAPLLAALPTLAAAGASGQFVLDDSVSLLSTAARARLRPGLEVAPTRSWDVVSAWVRANGGSGAFASVTTNETLHGGDRVRGIVARERIANGTTLLRIPRKLWLWLENFPAIRDLQLSPFGPACVPLDDTETAARLKMAVAMALELHKGESSFFSPWLQTLPTLEDFRAFHPGLTSESVAADFKALPFMKMLHEDQAKVRAVQRCFEAWRAQPQSIISEVTWDEVHGAWMNFLTRAYSVPLYVAPPDFGGGPIFTAAMVPLGEFGNFGSSAAATSVWSAEPEDDFTLKLRADLRPGEELLESYCIDCGKSQVLMDWGFYLEDDARRLPLASCGEPGSEERERLERAAWAMLDASNFGSGLAAPRCKASAVAREEQGPLRCSLARLAWETCLRADGQEGF